jgi:hypothetical protein
MMEMMKFVQSANFASRLILTFLCTCCANAFLKSFLKYKMIK